MTDAIQTERTVTRGKQEAENIRLLNSIQDSIVYLQIMQKKLDFYINKYFPVDKNNLKETKIRRII